MVSSKMAQRNSATSGAIMCSVTKGSRTAACRDLKSPPGKERDAFVKRARQTDTTAHVSEWVNSPGLQPPK
jgi:hypothetical protein